MMKIKLEVNFPGLSAEIEEENLNMDMFELLDKLMQFVDSDKYSSIKAINNDREKKSKISSIIVKDKEPPEISKYSEPIKKIANDVQINPEKIQMLYDFGADLEIPPLLMALDTDIRTEQQRMAVLLFLYYNNTVKNEDKISSFTLSPILTKSNIDPSELSKAFKGEYAKFVKIDGKTYRITPQGIIEARKILKNLITKYID